MDQYSFSFYCDDSWSFSTLLSRALGTGADTAETAAAGWPDSASGDDRVLSGHAPDASDPRQLSLLA